MGRTYSIKAQKGSDGKDFKIMGLINANNQTFLRLKNAWKREGIKFVGNSIKKIKDVEQTKRIYMPDDFKQFYTEFNGMESLYPNDMDKEGFLFYPLDGLISAANEFSDSNFGADRKIYIFAEYMHKSWWYAFEFYTHSNYTIGIIPEKNIFNPISSKLNDFLELYLENSSKLYV